ncbi:Indoleamine 2,3-dioxygenase-domain-containing protein [Phakopsora pachyrhizi]|uniref:Indoleamine 2,3-dioxygenase-domain-containing protein n=1 Tax=Phakopsora pachyrhizi TaxID=170000 RepID=A0AAV0BRR7_PHAPC|nr:Indoleamine 2,3-dioxygenase-domain-containing protein [Phakopsora pachyrhizi]
MEVASCLGVRHQLGAQKRQISGAPGGGYSAPSFGMMEFNVDVHSGFLPSLTQIAKFEQDPWTVWEDVLDSMKGFRVGTKNSDKAEKDGFSVLVPRSISIPFCAVSDALDMPPVLTYANMVLYNWSLIDPSAGLEASNIHIPKTFAATNSEAHFLKTSVLVKALGPACLALMQSSLDKAFLRDALSICRICRNLGQLSKMIDHITQVLQDVCTDCDPRTFYREIRPWYNGGECVK